jgi:hypothetical protein
VLACGAVIAVIEANGFLNPPRSSPFEAAGDSVLLPKENKGVRGAESPMGSMLSIAVVDQSWRLCFTSLIMSS